MKTLKIEPFSGISGDMMLGALVHLGAPREMLLDLPRLLGFPDVNITIKNVDKCGIGCIKVNIEDNTEPVARHLHNILEMIENADLSAGAKEFAAQVFTLVGEAEAKVHGVSIEEVHFHEVGAVDSIMDIVGTALLLDQLDFSSVVSLPVCVGSGFVHCAHGKLPVPAPATELLLQGLPSFPGDIAKEMTTPTGAAILKALNPSFTIPVLNMEASGYGAGERDFQQPNCLRIGLGEPVSGKESGAEQIIMIQTNLDDVSGELLGGHFQDLLLENGALDLSLSPVVMKKGRPGQRLEVLCTEAKLQVLTELILNETTTIGVRYWRADRTVLSRTFETVKTDFGQVRLKCVTLPSGSVRKVPEYEDCRKCAVSAGVTVQEVMMAAMRLCG
jgi:pyridinium-3,5-bisthiocarboxylic acid mononucleotide nickel chelatase